MDRPVRPKVSGWGRRLSLAPPRSHTGLSLAPSRSRTGTDHDLAIIIIMLCPFHLLGLCGRRRDAAVPVRHQPDARSAGPLHLRVSLRHGPSGPGGMAHGARCWLGHAGQQAETRPGVGYGEKRSLDQDWLRHAFERLLLDHHFMDSTISRPFLAHFQALHHPRTRLVLCSAHCTCLSDADLARLQSDARFVPSGPHDELGIEPDIKATVWSRSSVRGSSVDETNGSGGHVSQTSFEL